MDFKTASNALFDRVSHKALASELGISVAAIRQSRLDVTSKAYRSPPKFWRRAIQSLAETRIRRYHELIGEIEKDEAADRASSGSAKTK